MKVLLEKCVPVDLRHHLAPHQVHTAEWAGLKGLSNRQLLRAAEAAGYDVLLTTDRGMYRQQNVANRSIAILTLRSRSSELQHLLAHVTEIVDAIANISHGTASVLQLA